MGQTCARALLVLAGLIGAPCAGVAQPVQEWAHMTANGGHPARTLVYTGLRNPNTIRPALLGFPNGWYEFRGHYVAADCTPITQDHSYALVHGETLTRCIHIAPLVQHH